MATERKPRKPAVKGKKQVLKITREVRELYLRGKYMNFFEHVYVPLTDTIEYIVTPSWFNVGLPDYGRLHGSVQLIYFTVEFGVSTDVLREHIESMWKAIADSIAGKIIAASELDKTIPDESMEFEVLDISDAYMESIRKILIKVLRRR